MFQRNDRLTAALNETETGPGMKNSAINRAIPWNSGQVIAWILSLFSLTVLGALPLMLQGQISAALDHLHRICRW
jgi:hypothetical protein